MLTQALQWYMLNGGQYRISRLEKNQSRCIVLFDASIVNQFVSVCCGLGTLYPSVLAFARALGWQAPAGRGSQFSAPFALSMLIARSMKARTLGVDWRPSWCTTLIGTGGASNCESTVLSRPAAR